MRLQIATNVAASGRGIVRFYRTFFSTDPTTLFLESVFYISESKFIDLSGLLTTPEKSDFLITCQMENGSAKFTTQLSGIVRRAIFNNS